MNEWMNDPEAFQQDFEELQALFADLRSEQEADMVEYDCVCDYCDAELVTGDLVDGKCPHCGWEILDTDAPFIDESMDGDHESALASIGWGTDEDYGYYGGDEM